MSRLRYLNLLLLIFALLIPGCTRQSSVGKQATAVSVDLNFKPNPPVVGEGMIYLEVRDQNGQPIKDLDIQVKGDMTHAGMTPVFGTSTDEGKGRYSIPFEWTMAGDWILQIAADLPDGRLLNRSFEARVQPE